MQTIKMYLRADSVVAEVVDAHNQASSAELPYLTRGMAVDIVLGLYADADSEQLMPAEQLRQYASFDFCMASDWDTSTPVQIRVTDGIRVDDQGLVHVVIGNTATAELLAQLGNAESIVLGAELDGYVAGEDVPALVLQWDMGVRNRRMDDSTQTPPAVPSGYYTASQLRAMLSASLDFQFSRDGQSWHEVQTASDEYFRARSTATEAAEWSEPMAVPRGADGRTVNPDGIGPIAERPIAPIDGYCWMSSDEGKAYWYQDGSWTEGVPLTTVPGPQGDQGIQGTQGEQGIQGEPFRFKDFTADQLAALKGKQGDKGDKGDKGDQGAAGDGLHIDKTDSSTRRHLSDNAPAGFVFLATDIYCDTITVSDGGTFEHDDTGDLLDADGVVVAYVWRNPSIAEHPAVYSRLSYPTIGSTAYYDEGCTAEPVLVTDKGPSYNLYYQKNTTNAGDWSHGVRTYIGRKGDKGDKGERGLKGNDGDAAYAQPDVVFLDAADPERPALPVIDTADALVVPGTKPIAEVLRRIADPDNPGHEAYLRADEGTDYSLRYCLDEQHTVMYVLHRDQWSLGGRIRYAQAGALTPQFLHVGYAASPNGEDFALTPNNHREYRAEIYTASQGDPTYDDFVAANAVWIHYFSGGGGGGGGTADIAVDGTTIVKRQDGSCAVGEIPQGKVTNLTDDLNKKITAPAGGTSGQVLTKTDNGTAWKSITVPEGGSGTSITTLQLTKPANGFHLVIMQAGEDGTRANGTRIIDTRSNEDDRAKVTAYMDDGSDGKWVVCPAEGFADLFDGVPVAIDLADVPTPAILYYAWSNEDGDMSDWHSQRFPAVGGGGGGVFSDVTPLPQPSGESHTVACLCLQAPQAMIEGMIWVKGGTYEPQYISGVGTPAIVTDGTADPSTAADYTIIINQGV